MYVYLWVFVYVSPYPVLCIHPQPHILPKL